MAKTTNLDLRNQMIYQVFVRQHSKTHDFRGVIDDLERIKDLGCDILYLLPIQEVGKVNQKGSVGCPYSIKDYTKIEEDLGTLEDFKELIDKTHKLGMKLIIDCVYNHTSRDSYLVKTHPEWFYHKENGEFANRIGDWSDVTDLNYNCLEQYDYLTDCLMYYLDLGVDGYRCDVAPLIKEDFWKYAISKCKEKHPDSIWLSESVHLGFLKYVRDMGYEAMSDCEVFNYFDMLYDYDIFPVWEAYCKGEATLDDWVKELIRQESAYPKNYVKARYLENHDMPRAASYLDETKIRCATSLIFFLKGIAFIYAGQEAYDSKLPSLFEYDEVDWSNYNKYHLADLIKLMSKIKKDDIFKDGVINYYTFNKDVLVCEYENAKKKMIGIFNLSGMEQTVKLKLINPHTNEAKYILRNGLYHDLISDEELRIVYHEINLNFEPVVVEVIK